MKLLELYATLNESSYQVEVLSPNQMYEEVRKDESVIDRLKYLVFSEIKSEIHLVVKDGEKIVGVGGLQQNPYEETELWGKHVSVDPEYKKRGIASAIIEKMYHYAEQNNKTLKGSSYSDEGGKHLPKVNKRLMQKYPNVKIAPKRKGTFY